MALIFLSQILNIPSLENKPSGMVLSILELFRISFDAFIIFKSSATINSLTHKFLTLYNFHIL